MLTVNYYRQVLTLSAPVYFLSDHAHSPPPIFYKKMVEKFFQNCSYRDDDVTSYVHCFEKLCEKWLKYVFFLKLTL